MSSGSGELVFGKLLICLGYEDKEKYLTNKNLFVVPNKDAFQKVILYLRFEVYNCKKFNFFPRLYIFCFANLT